MNQAAPHPEILGDLVMNLRYWSGWKFYLADMDRGQGCKGLTLVINLSTTNAYRPSDLINVNHLFPVPAAAYDYRSWRRWLFDRIMDVHRHEAMEAFRIVFAAGTEERPYAPSHGPGNDPYMVREVGTLTDQKTSFRGDLNA
jgi:hypothetical protein